MNTHPKPAWPRRCLLLFGMTIALLVASPALVLAEGPVIDGQFADWEGYGFITDPVGDSQTPNTDIIGFAWASVPDVPYVFFMLMRQKPSSANPKVYYNIYIDTNNDGNFGSAQDRRVEIMYDPQSNSSEVVVTVYTGAGVQISQQKGDWGDSMQEGGQRCECMVSFADLGIIARQTISMYVTAGPNPGSNSDRAPDRGTITWTPIPTLGWVLSGLLIAGAIGLVWYTRRRQLWPSTSASAS